MAKNVSKKYKGLFKIIKSAFSELVKCERIELKGSFRLPDKKIEFPVENYPLELHIGQDAHVLHLYPEKLIGNGNDEGEEISYILFDPDNYYSNVSGFYRLEDGDKITLGQGDKQQRAFLNTPKKIPERQLSISNEEGKLIFKCHHPDTGSCIAPLLKDKKLNKVNEWRKKKVNRLAKIIGDPTKKLSSKEAMKLIQDVNQLMENEAYREKDNNDKPGGVLTIPEKKTVFIIGDLHTRLDNLLTILCQNNFLEAMENDQACLVILGDAVHPEIEGMYDKMDSSQVIMDVIFRLKLHFPKQLFYIRGNHDSFSEEIGKMGVPQGVLWAKQLSKDRGKAYKKEMQRYYDSLPYLAYSKNFITCHASPPTSAVNLHALVNINSYPHLIADLTNKRFKTPNRMSGYHKGDIKKLRSCLKVSDETPFIVGHTPMDNEQTIWEEVGDIANHYIVYAGHPDWVGVMTQIGDGMYPLLYPVEMLSEQLKNLSEKT